METTLQSKFELSTNSLLEVVITPCNQGQSMTYNENFVGMTRDVLLRSQEILRGLKKLFPNGDFSVKIEDSNLENSHVLDIYEIENIIKSL